VGDRMWFQVEWESHVQNSENTVILQPHFQKFTA
jgi:hypothetical protein